MGGPENTLPMMGGTGPFGSIEMGGTFTVVKVRDGLPRSSTADPGWYKHPKGTLAWRVAKSDEQDAPMPQTQHHHHEVKP